MYFLLQITVYKVKADAQDYENAEPKLFMKQWGLMYVI